MENCDKCRGLWELWKEGKRCIDQGGRARAYREAWWARQALFPGRESTRL
jgi:hypothetical protein